MIIVAILIAFNLTVLTVFDNLLYKSFLFFGFRAKLFFCSSLVDIYNMKFFQLICAISFPLFIFNTTTNIILENLKPIFQKKLPIFNKILLFHCENKKINKDFH